MTIVWRYYDTSIFTSRRDGPEQSGFPVTLKPDFLRFRISQNSVFQNQQFFSKNRQQIIKKSPEFFLGAAPLPPTKVGAKCLAAVVLDNPDRALRPTYKYITSKQHSCVQGPLQEPRCRLIQSGASGLPYYCTPFVWVPDVIEGLAVRWHNNKRRENC